MLRRHFDPSKPHRYVRYGRMSSESQNQRSPDQQFQEIESTLRRLGHPWVHVGDYRDDAVSGRYNLKRHGFQKMLGDIRKGALKVDLILVHTFERLGRSDELHSIRKNLLNAHGVLVLTADSLFADPTTPQGQVMGTFENLRAVEENRIKAEQVLRGKRDAARSKHWPGGNPPFGYMLKSVIIECQGRNQVGYCILVPNPATDWIIKKTYQLAFDTGFGCTRLTRILNADPDIPSKYKPFYEQTVNYWLQQSIYYGELVWEEHSTGVVDDCRVVQRNPEDQVLHVPDFCEPLVPWEQWKAIQELRRVRNERKQLARLAKKDNDKQIAAITPGIALKYLLSGLVFCGRCDRSMTVSRSPAYIDANGVEKHYGSYFCPGSIAGVCPNNTRVPEEWLRETVVELICKRLFPTAG